MVRRRSAYVHGGLGLALLVAVLASGSAGAAGAAVMCRSQVATIVGTEGSDELVGLPGPDVIAGLGGDDRITGDLTDDVVCGGEGNDTVVGAAVHLGYGGSRDDHLEVTGGPTDKSSGVYGEEGDDTLLGGPNGDRLVPGPGRDSVDGGAGDDTVGYYEAAGAVSVNLLRGVAKGEGRDTLTGIENIDGTVHADRLTGDDGPNSITDFGGVQEPPFDVIRGGGGDDSFWAWGGTLLGGRGDDTMQLRYLCCHAPVDDHFDGGAGYDWIRFYETTGPVTFDLDAGTATGGIGNDVALRFEAARGTSGDDVFIGNGADNEFIGGYGEDRFDGRAGNDTLSGGYLDDTLLGGDGNDLLDGGAEYDTLDGGSGADTCLNGESLTECE